MRTRINLFRQVKRTSQMGPQFNLNSLKEIKVGFNLMYGVGLTTMLMSVLGVQYHKYRTEIDGLNTRLVQLTQEHQAALSDMNAKLEAHQKRVAEAKIGKPAIERVPEQKQVVNVDLDSTWSSVLWKLSTMTIDPVVINRMEMSRAGEDARKVDITGNAESLKEFRDWLETLNRYLPSSDFVVENQSVGDKGKEIRFKLTAKIS